MECFCKDVSVSLLLSTRETERKRERERERGKRKKGDVQAFEEEFLCKRNLLVAHSAHFDFANEAFFENCPTVSNEYACPSLRITMAGVLKTFTSLLIFLRYFFSVLNLRNIFIFHVRILTFTAFLRIFSICDKVDQLLSFSRTNKQMSVPPNGYLFLPIAHRFILII